ncbi:MAG: hypothetical protein D3923_07215 [Candidatus Electrothrix sp. AR3]|nr:hypothetical protein [Candidatus Electrothrix sp. AR3]
MNDQTQQQISLHKNIKITVEPKEVFAGQPVTLTVDLNGVYPDGVQVVNDIEALELTFISSDGLQQYYTNKLKRVRNDTYQGASDTKNWREMFYSPTKINTFDGVGKVLGEILINEEIGIEGTPLVSIKKSLSSTVISRSHTPHPTDDQAFWVAIRNRTKSIGFDRYAQFIQNVFCDNGAGERIIRSECTSSYNGRNENDLHVVDRISQGKKDLRINAADSYTVLRLATQVFLLLESGIVLEKNDSLGTLFDEDQERIRLDDAGANFDSVSSKLEQYLDGTQGGVPYLHRILEALLGPYDKSKWGGKLAYCNGVLQHRFSSPGMLELIWSYWHEEAMLVQSMNAMALRFQNRRGAGKRDPLAHLEIDPLRGVNNLLWGYIQNEHNRLTLTRRSYEYDHHYGISLHGKAVPAVRSADTRSKFLEGFHNVLNKASDFYRQNANSQINADAFPLLNAIKQVHLCLAEGAHNQFGDLPWTARVEMLIEQWILARPEQREFLRERAMVPYREPWMGRVDAMKTLQGWTDTPVTNFNELAVFGEQLILSLRYGDWVDVNDEEQARNWVIYWKPEIQSYINAYQIATGVDLSTKLRDGKQVDSTPPSKHLLRRLQKQHRGPLAA